MSAGRQRPLTALQQAEGEYQRRQAVVQEWAGQMSASQERLASLEIELDRVLVDEPEAAAGIVEQMQSAGEGVRLAERALGPTRGVLLKAGRAVVAAMADELQPEIDRCQAELDAHEAKTQELLAALVEHSGSEWRPRDPEREWRDAGGGGRFVVPVVPADRLEAALRPLVRQQRLLRAAVAGQSLREAWPQLTLDDLPACLHPATGVLPAAEFSAEHEERQRRAQEQAEWDAEVARQQAQLDRLLQQFEELAGTTVLPSFARSGRLDDAGRVNLCQGTPSAWHDHLVEIDRLAGPDIAARAAAEVRRRTSSSQGVAA